MLARLAILGLDPVQREWLAAVESLRAAGEIELVGVGHRTLALAKDVAELFSSEKEAVPAFDDPRQVFPQLNGGEGNEQSVGTKIDVLLVDRLGNATLEFLIAAIQAGTTVLSLGPPVETLPEAHKLAAELEPQTHLLYIWPRFENLPGPAQGNGAVEFLRPLRFAAAQWYGLNHVLAKLTPRNEKWPPAVRSLSVLAWDALSTLIGYFDVPMSVYASVRGTVPSGESFADLTGTAAITLRFPEDASASLTLSDRLPRAFPTELTLIGHGSPASSESGNAGGTLTFDASTYMARDGNGTVVETSAMPMQETSHDHAVGTLREVLKHRGMSASPQRGWLHRLVDVAATMEALVVSHRTGQAESPERLRSLRR